MIARDDRIRRNLHGLRWTSPAGGFNPAFVPGHLLTFFSFLTERNRGSAYCLLRLAACTLGDAGGLADGNHNAACLPGRILRQQMSARGMISRRHAGSRRLLQQGETDGDADPLLAAVDDPQGKAYDRLRGTARAVRDRGHQAMDVSRGAVEQKPLTYVVTAFTAGVVLASFFGWKKSSCD